MTLECLSFKVISFTEFISSSLFLCFRSFGISSEGILVEKQPFGDSLPEDEVEGCLFLMDGIAR